MISTSGAIESTVQVRLTGFEAWPAVSVRLDRERVRPLAARVGRRTSPWGTRTNEPVSSLHSIATPGSLALKPKFVAVWLLRLPFGGPLCMETVGATLSLIHS